MKLKKIIAGILALVMVLTAVPTEFVANAETGNVSKTGTIKANESDYILVHEMGRSVNSITNTGYSGQISEAFAKEVSGSLGTNNPYYLDNYPEIFKKERLPYVAMNVDAAQAGTYTMQVSMNVRSSALNDAFAVIVDGQKTVYNFGKTKGDAAQTVDIPLTLSQGQHTVVFTSIMPKTKEVASSVSSSNWYNYYATNSGYYGFVLPDGLSVLKAPTVKEVKASVGIIEAKDTNYVLLHEMGRSVSSITNTGYSGQISDAFAKEVSGSLGTNNPYYLDNYPEIFKKERLPYVAMNVDAAQAGTYTMQVSMNVRSSALNDTFAVIVDGQKTVYNFGKTKGDAAQTVDIPLTLSQGQHTVVFTSIMPKTKEVASSVSSSNWYNYYATNSGYYGFVLPEGVIALDAPSESDVLQSVGIFNVFNSAYIYRNHFEKASDDTNNATYELCGGGSNSNKGNVRCSSCAQAQVNKKIAYRDNYDNNTDYSKIFNLSMSPTVFAKEDLAYVAMKVNADVAGTYEFVLNMAGRGDLYTTTIGAIVNGQTQVIDLGSKIKSDSFSDFEVNVQLEQGENIVVFTTLLPSNVKAVSDAKQAGKGWGIVLCPRTKFRTFTVPSGVEMLAAPTKNEVTASLGWVTLGSRVNALDSDKVYLNHFGHQNDNGTYQVCGSASGEKCADCASTNKRLEYQQSYLNNSLVPMFHLDMDPIGFVTNDLSYAAMKVNANNAGTYKLLVEMGSRKSAITKTFGVIVNGEMQVVDTSAYFENADAYDGKRIVEVDITLDQGSNILVFTTFMPENEEQATAAKETAKDSGWYNVQVIRTRYYSFQFEDGVTVENGLTKAEVETSILNGKEVPSTTGIEAEDEKFVEYFGGYQAFIFPGSSSGKTVGADDVVVKENSFGKDGYYNWGKTPYVEFVVNAQEAGKYNISVNTIALCEQGMEQNKVPAVALFVNNKLYTKELEKSWGELEQTTLEVELKKGNNTVKCFAIAKDVKTGLNLFFDSFEFDTNSTLNFIANENAEKEATVVKAGDETKVLSNLYTDKGDNLGDSARTELQNDKLSLDVLETKDLIRVPYAAMKVTAEEEGYYYIRLKTGKPGFDTSANSSQIGLMVDGLKVYSLSFEKEEEPYIATTIYLSKGTHVLVFTSPMPEDKDTAATITKGYPWFNMEEFVLEKGLVVEKAPTSAEVETPYQMRIEAEDKEYTVSNLNYSDVEKTSKDNKPGASGNKLAKGSYTNVKQSFDELKDYIDLNGTPYVQYAVKAESAGTYTISVCAYPGKWGTTTTVEKPFITVWVNGEAQQKEVEGRWNTYQTVDFDVELKKGINIIRCTDITKEQVQAIGLKEDGKTANGGVYMHHDYLAIPKEAGLSVCAVKELKEQNTYTLFDVNDAAEPTKIRVFSDSFTHKVDEKTKETYYASPTRNSMKNGKLSLESLKKDLTSGNIANYPTIEFKVKAPSAGYYNLSLKTTTDVSVTGKSALIVNENDVYALNLFTNGKSQNPGATVYLKAGVNTIKFTSPMPINSVNANALGNDKTKLDKAYPWMDIYSISMDNGATLVDETKAVVMAGDTSKVMLNRYEAKNNNLVNASTNYLRSNKLTTTSFIAGNLNFIPYASLRVEVPTEGTYSFTALTSTNVDSFADQLCVVVDGKAVHNVDFNIKSHDSATSATVEVKLTKGIHIITFTTPMPKDTAEYDAYAKEYEAKNGKKFVGGNGATHPWMDMKAFLVDESLKVLDRTAKEIVEAETSKYTNLIKVQDGEEKEKASGNKVLGSTNRNRIAAEKMTLDKFTAEQIKLAPYFAFTVEAPEDGYYALSMNMAGDGRLPASTLAMLVDGVVNTVYYNRTGNTTADTNAHIQLYLSKGTHVLTFTSPIPLNAEIEADYSRYWMNFDYITLFDGLKLAKEQKAPTDIKDFEKIEVEEYGMLNMNRISDDGLKIGKAQYRRAQKLANILKNGIDPTVTPFSEYTIYASEAGDYKVYIASSYGLTDKASAKEIDAHVVVESNGKFETHTIHTEKGKTSAGLLAATLSLKKGLNTVRITHCTSDSLSGEGLAWIDYNYIEMPADTAKKLEFVPVSDVIEAENMSCVSYTSVLSDTSTGGAHLGRADYGYIDENDITFESLDVENLDDIPRVTYTFVAEKAGRYNLSVEFGAGLTHYTTEDMNNLGKVGFAMIVNESSKELIELEISSMSMKTTRLFEVDLQEGENKITFTTSLAEYMTGVKPRIEDEYKLVWFDHDALRLSSGLDASGESEKYELSDSDYNFGQIKLKEFSKKDVQEVDSRLAELIPAIAIGGVSSLLLLALFIIILKKKREQNRHQE